MRPIQSAGRDLHQCSGARRQNDSSRFEILRLRAGRAACLMAACDLVGDPGRSGVLASIGCHALHLRRESVVVQPSNTAADDRHAADGSRPVCNARLKTAAQRKRSASAGKGKAAAAPAPANAARKKRRLNPRGARAEHRGDEGAVGGAEEGQGGGEIGRAGESDAGDGQTRREARRPEKRGQEINAGGPAAEGARPEEGGGKAAGRGEGAGRDRRGAGPVSSPPPVANASIRPWRPLASAARSPYEAWIAADPSAAASGFSSRDRGASKGRSRSLSAKLPSASHAPPRAGAWPPHRGSGGLPGNQRPRRRQRPRRPPRRSAASPPRGARGSARRRRGGGRRPNRA